MKKIYVLIFSLSLLANASFAQNGTPGAPFHFLGQARNISTAGTYYFNIGGTPFSTFVDTSGWVLVASSTGVSMTPLAPSTALGVGDDAILPTAIYTDIANTEVRFFATSGPNTPFNVQTADATVAANLHANQTLSVGLDGQGTGMWTGTGTIYLDVWGPVVAIRGLDEFVYQSNGNPNGFNWRQPGEHKVDFGQIGNNGFNLFVRAPLVTLPVELISFDAVAQTDKIRLDWSTAQEFNSAYFSVEKSLDGFHWQSIGKLNAAGNTDQRKDYIFTDRSPVGGNQYYRLRQVDLNGVTKTSNSRTVNFVSKNMKPVLVYPNPATDYLSVRLNTQVNTVSTVRLIDLSGNILVTSRTSSGSLQIDTRRLPTGMYVLEVNTDGDVQRLSVIKK